MIVKLTLPVHDPEHFAAMQVAGGPVDPYRMALDSAQDRIIARHKAKLVRSIDTFGAIRDGVPSITREIEMAVEMATA